jgi:hypothetical protein
LQQNDLFFPLASLHSFSLSKRNVIKRLPPKRQTIMYANIVPCPTVNFENWEKVLLLLLMLLSYNDESQDKSTLVKSFDIVADPRVVLPIQGYMPECCEERACIFV